jgi:hypothetical protein
LKPILAAALCACLAFAQQQPDAKNKRIELNLIGTAATDEGESRRNENVQFNLVDNNALKELNVRLGVTATLVEEFTPSRNWWAAGFGYAVPASIHLAPRSPFDSFHGSVRWSHLNSVTSARTFFQVGGAQPAHENDFSGDFQLKPWRGASFSAYFGGQAIRGSVNGNVLAPRAGERTALTTDPATRAIVERYLAAYPDELPNRSDVHPRMLNRNAPQRIDSLRAGSRLDQALRGDARLFLDYQYTGQTVDAFQLVAGQNPDTSTRSHRARATWSRPLAKGSVVETTLGFDRIGTLLVPEPNAVGPMVATGGLETLGPQAVIPLNRAVNNYRAGAQYRHSGGRFDWGAGGAFNRRQLNGSETDSHRGYFSFGNDFGRDSVTNLRLGIPSQHLISIGDIHRGFRHWEADAWIYGRWRPSAALSTYFGMRYAPTGKPGEVYNRNTILYDADLNNVAPSGGIAWKPGRRWGALRVGGGVHFGEIYPVTYQQVRFSPPGSVKIVIMAPSLINPLQGADPGLAKGNIYTLDAGLCTPYELQYNASWEPGLGGNWRLQLGYTGNRSHKLLFMYYQNRAHPVDGIAQTTATINQRRPDASIADYRRVVNGSQGYYDAARVSLSAPRARGFTIDFSYWFSKAMDLGSSYTNTAYDADTRLGRNQWEYESQVDLKARSDFDQPHAVLARTSWESPVKAGRWLRGIRVSFIGLLKSGTPFSVITGSDAPGFGNVDGNGGDRPNLIDPSILGRTIGDPDTSRSLLPRSAFYYMKPTDAKGNLGRNTFRKGRIANVNSSIEREWRFDGSRRLVLRAESVNVLNTPQFADPGKELANLNFGFITNTLNEGRTWRGVLSIGW